MTALRAHRPDEQLLLTECGWQRRSFGSSYRISLVSSRHQQQLLINYTAHKLNYQLNMWLAERLLQVGIVVCAGYRLRVGASSLDAPIDSRLLPGPRPPHCNTHPLRAHVCACTCAHFLWSIGGGGGVGGWGGGEREKERHNIQVNTQYKDAT
jgi:hypothetical protein